MKTKTLKELKKEQKTLKKLSDSFAKINKALQYINSQKHHLPKLGEMPDCFYNDLKRVEAEIKALEENENKPN